MRLRDLRHRSLLLAIAVATLVVAPSAHAATLTVTPGPTEVAGPYYLTYTVSGTASAAGSVAVTTNPVSTPCPATLVPGNDTTAVVTPAGNFSVAGRGAAFAFSGGSAATETREPEYRLCGYLTATDYSTPGAATETATAEAVGSWAAAACPAAPGVFDISYLGAFGGGNTIWGVTVALTATGKFDAAIGATAVSDGSLAFGRLVETKAPGTFVVFVSDGWNSRHLSASQKQPGRKYTLATRFDQDPSAQIPPCLQRGNATTKPFHEFRQTVVIPPAKVTAALVSVGGKVTRATAAAVRASGYTISIRDKAVGTAAITWYAADATGVTRVPLATGSVKTASTGTSAIKVRLTPLGRSTVKPGMRLYSVATFKAAGVPLQSYALPFVLR